MATSGFAQDSKTKSKDKLEKSEEIIIRKNGDKTEKMTIVVDGETITLNGKPIDEYKSGDVTIRKRERSMPGAAPRIRAFGGTDNLDIDLENFNMERLIPTGVNKAMLGVVTSKAEGGLKVTEVTKESGAAKAGLLKDDIITKIGNTPITDSKELTEAIGKLNPNDKVEVTYKRNGKEAKTTATLGENKGRRMSFNLNNDNMGWNDDGGGHGGSHFNYNFNRKPKIGLQIQDVEEGKGVTIKDVDDESPAAKAGIKEGDIITQVDGKEIVGVDEMKQQIKDLKEGDALKVTYKRNGQIQTTEIKIPKKLKTADL
jgi:serine protease Do